MSKVCKCKCLPIRNQLVLTNNECDCSINKKEETETPGTTKKCGVWPDTVAQQKCPCGKNDKWFATPVIEIHQGKLFGKVCADLNGRSYHSFQGIPYAKPPLEHLRFLVCIKNNGNCQNNNKKPMLQLKVTWQRSSPKIEHLKN